MQYYLVPFKVHVRGTIRVKATSVKDAWERIGYEHFSDSLDMQVQDQCGNVVDDFGVELIKTGIKVDTDQQPYAVYDPSCEFCGHDEHPPGKCSVTQQGQFCDCKCNDA